MHTERPTIPDLAGPSVSPTHPPMSRNRAEGILWSERLFAQAAPASSDAARFAAGLLGDIA